MSLFFEKSHKWNTSDFVVSPFFVDFTFIVVFQGFHVYEISPARQIKDKINVTQIWGIIRFHNIHSQLKKKGSWKYERLEWPTDFN